MLQPAWEHLTMSLLFYGHPFSSYCNKVLIALYENATPFEWRPLGPDEADNGREFARLWPIMRMPVLVDAGHAVMESSIIIEYLGLHHPGPAALVPRDAGQALDVRMLDRFFDLYVMTPMQAVVFNALRPEDDRDPTGVARAKSQLETAYGWIEATLGDRTWAAGDEFSMADCAAAPALFFADWTLPIPGEHKRLRAYRQRLLARPSVARVIDEARPYRRLFPLGAPDRD